VVLFFIVPWFGVHGRSLDVSPPPKPPLQFGLGSFLLAIAGASAATAAGLVFVRSDELSSPFGQLIRLALMLQAVAVGLIGVAWVLAKQKRHGPFPQPFPRWLAWAIIVVVGGGMSLTGAIYWSMFRP
jgi:hypothetical protein